MAIVPIRNLGGGGGTSEKTYFVKGGNVVVGSVNTLGTFTINSKYNSTNYARYYGSGSDNYLYFNTIIPIGKTVHIKCYLNGTKIPFIGLSTSTSAKTESELFLPTKFTNTTVQEYVLTNTTVARNFYLRVGSGDEVMISDIWYE